MNPKQPEPAILRIHPFPTRLAQTLQLTELAIGADPGTVQVLANSAIAFASMPLECAATSCLEFAKLPKRPLGKIDRLGVLDKFDLLHWMAVRTPLDRGLPVAQKMDDLVSARNELVHARMKRVPFGTSREWVAGESVEAGADDAIWNALRIPKDERSWVGEHARLTITAVVDFLNYFFFETCKVELKTVVQMLCTASGDVIFKTPWESDVLSGAAHRLGLKLRFLGM